MNIVRAATLICLLAISTPVAAQNAIGREGPSLGPPNGMSRNSLNEVPTGTDNWSRCSDTSPASRERAIRSCGRVIGERMSRATTAYAHYYRARHHEMLGDGLRTQQDYARAIELLDAEVSASRNSAYVYYNRALVLEYFSEFDRALADLRHASELNEEWGAPHYQIGRIHFQLSDYPAAIVAFERASELNEDDSYNHGARCEALAAQSDFTGAETACAEAVRLSDKDGWALFSRGFLHFKRGDIAAAHADFAAAIEENEDNQLAWYGRGVAAIRLGRQAEGEADITRADLSAHRRDHYANAGLRP